MSYFEDREVYIEGVERGKIKISFYANDDIPEVIDVRTSCSCMSGRFYKNGNLLVVKYKPSLVPLQRRGIGHYITNKSVYVDYKNGEIDVLNITSKIRKK